MDINNQFDQELLSAYLDGALTAAELAEVESWLASDQAAVDYLGQLRENRSVLKALAISTRPGLKANFAQQVLAEALALRSSESAVSPNVQPAGPADRSARKWWLAVGSLATSAAAIAGLIFAFSGNRPHPDSLVSVPQGNLPGIEHAPEVPEASPFQPGPADPSAVPGVAPGGDLVGKGNQSAAEMHEFADAPQLDLVFVGDVVMTAKAWNDARFDELLTKHGIRFGQQYAAPRRSIVNLIENFEMVGADPDSDSKAEAAFVYLNSPGLLINKILVELENDRESYVDFKYTMVMGGTSLNGKSDYRDLLKGLRRDTAVGMARLIVPEDSNRELGGLLPVYHVSRRAVPKALVDGAANRVHDNAIGGNMPVGNSEMLLILRKQ